MASMREFLGSLFGRGGKWGRPSVPGMGGLANRDGPQVSLGNQASTLGQIGQQQSGDGLVKACGPGPGCNYPAHKEPAPTLKTFKTSSVLTNLWHGRGDLRQGLDLHTLHEQILREIEDRSGP